MDDRWDRRMQSGSRWPSLGKDPAPTAAKGSPMDARGHLCTPAPWVPEPLEPADRELLGCLQGESGDAAPPQGQEPRVAGQGRPWLVTQQSFLSGSSSGPWPTMLPPALALPRLAKVQGLKFPSANSVSHPARWAWGCPYHMSRARLPPDLGLGGRRLASPHQAPCSGPLLSYPGDRSL